MAGMGNLVGALTVRFMLHESRFEICHRAETALQATSQHSHCVTYFLWKRPSREDATDSDDRPTVAVQDQHSEVANGRTVGNAQKLLHTNL